MELKELLENCAGEIERLERTEMDIGDRNDVREGTLHLYELRIEELYGLNDKCAGCGDNMNGVIRIHHHTEKGKDITKA